MRVLLVLLLAAALPLVNALSPPQTADVVISGTPSRIDSDGGVWLAVSFANRDVLGLYNAEVKSYIEFETARPVEKTVFAGGKAVALLSSRNSLLVIDLATKNTAAKLLEFRAGGIASDGQYVYVSSPTERKIVKMEAGGLTVVESIEVDVADGLSFISAWGGTVWVVSSSLDTVAAVRDGRATSVKVDGLVGRIEAVKNAVWVVLTNDNVLKVSGNSIVQRTTLPRATFVSSSATLDDKLVYSSVSRRVVGVVDDAGYREASMPTQTPASVAAGSRGRIWFLDSSSNKIGFLHDSKPPTLSDWSLNRHQNGSAEVRVRVSDPDLDLASVRLVAVEHSGIYVSGYKYVEMTQSRGFYVGLYSPSPEVTRVELYVNATDAAANNNYQKVGELDYRTSTTSPAASIVTTAEPPATGPAFFSLLAELLLLVPLILVVMVFILNRKARRKPRKRK
ncbi:MAG: hypothetical protein NZ570_01225 [Candidatus Caldarchaeum sp.]|nr:hypothetical protein [Candidatus Caldarchaeum sp.]